MDLLNRYLNAVRFWLPKAQQDDIIAELAEDLRAQIEERQAALGHPLDDDAIAAVLKERGHPMLVAGSYLPQRSLIGPVLFPVYQYIVKLVILWILIPVFVLVVGPATILSGRDPFLALLSTTWTLLMAAVFAFGVITLVFAIMERHPFEKNFPWNPKRLPRVPKAASSPARPMSRVHAIFEVLASLFAAVLWIDLMRFPKSLDVDGILIVPTPVWHAFFWPILLLTLGRAVAGAIVWLRPWWTRTRLSVRLACDAVTLILLGALVNMGPWVLVVAPSLPGAAVANANHWANVGTSLGLGIASIITLVEGVIEARAVIRQQPLGSPAPVAVRR